MKSNASSNLKDKKNQCFTCKWLFARQRKINRIKKQKLTTNNFAKFFSLCFSNNKMEEKEDWRRTIILQTIVKCNGQSCTMEIDLSSCVSKDAVKKLCLKDQTPPYSITWLGWITPIWKLMKDACLHILLVIWLRMCNTISFRSKFITLFWSSMVIW